MNDFGLVMPMAGRGSRFSKMGIATPKPLIEIAGKPFFWWAVESLRRSVLIQEMVFVVLNEHCEQFDIDRRILSLYPDARVVRISDVTSGAAESAALGLRLLKSDLPVAINDCDHAFHSGSLEQIAQRFSTSKAAAALMCFSSENPAYSYAMVNDTGAVTGTVEKRVVSPHAIAGCYLFAHAALFLQQLHDYQKQCPYDELFISGIYNMLAAKEQRIEIVQMERHWSFGTPEEYKQLAVDELIRSFPDNERH